MSYIPSYYCIYCWLKHSSALPFGTRQTDSSATCQILIREVGVKKGQRDPVCHEDGRQGRGAKRKDRVGQHQHLIFLEKLWNLPLKDPIWHLIQWKCLVLQLRRWNVQRQPNLDIDCVSGHWGKWGWHFPASASNTAMAIPMVRHTAQQKAEAPKIAQRAMKAPWKRLGTVAHGGYRHTNQPSGLIFRG